MAVDKLVVIGWVFAALLASGISMIFAGKVLQNALGLVHKLLALLCFVLLFRVASELRAFETPPALHIAIVVFAVSYIAAFGTGIVQSIPACTSSLWLNLHRVAAIIAAIACGVVVCLIATIGRL